MDNRIGQLDVLRGIAVLGILIMNIKGFALISSMYINPLAMGPLSSAEWILFAIERLFVDYKFLAVFSLLFGAGIALLDQKLQDSNKNAYLYQLRRLTVLALVGAIHAFLLWYGDILLSYAVCGLVALLFVRLPVRIIAVVAIVFACVPFWYFISGQNNIQDAPVESIQGMVNSFWVPTTNNIASEIAGYTGTWAQQFDSRVSSVKFMTMHLFPRENFWKSTSLMLLGIALFKTGFFSNKWDTESYKKWGISLVTIGLAITSYGMFNDIQQNFALQTSLYLGRLHLYIGSMPMAIGYAALFYYFYSRNTFFT